MREILIATANPKKCREMVDILSGGGPTSAPQLETLPRARNSQLETLSLPVRWRTLAEFPDWPPPAEDAETFCGNAAIKAGYYARHSGLWTIAEDSGLEVDALGGDPGVRSARYAGEPCDDTANNRLLIERLRGVPPERRTARFRCCVALSDGHRVLARAEGSVEGRVIDHPLGEDGFGYDPHFWVDRLGMTTAQMPAEQKHAISHRGQALGKLREQLGSLL